MSCSVEGGEKVGVCGRTGSGKSTLMLALLRLVEGAEGGIEVDGWDIKHVPLQTLRNKVGNPYTQHSTNSKSSLGDGSYVCFVRPGVYHPSGGSALLRHLPIQPVST